MIVTCLYLRVSGKFNAELEVKTHSHLSDQSQKPDIWLVDKCSVLSKEKKAIADALVLSLGNKEDVKVRLDDLRKEMEAVLDNLR